MLFYLFQQVRLMIPQISVCLHGTTMGNHEWMGICCFCLVDGSRFKHNWNRRHICISHWEWQHVPPSAPHHVQAIQFARYQLDRRHPVADASLPTPLAGAGPHPLPPVAMAPLPPMLGRLTTRWPPNSSLAMQCPQCHGQRWPASFVASLVASTSTPDSPC